MANSNYYLGNDPQTTLGDTPRFFYGLRRGEDGSLYLVRSDQIRDKDAIQLNDPGEDTENYNDFEVGIDFFEGRDVYHNKVYDNLRYEQYRWDDRAMFYYIDDDGQLVVRINNGYTYESLTAP
jgi:hypothetical protein